MSLDHCNYNKMFNESYIIMLLHIDCWGDMQVTKKFKNKIVKRVRDEGFR